jgi:hypothetical protein
MSVLDYGHVIGDNGTMEAGDHSATNQDGKSSNRLYGRESQLDAFLARQEALLLLTGGSGIGKSDFLTAARNLVNASEFRAPAIRSAREAPGTLQRVIIELATEAIEELIKVEPLLERFTERLYLAAKKLSKDRGSKLATAIMNDLVNFAKSRLGDGVGQALIEYAKEVRGTETELEALRARISAAADPEVLAVAVDLTHEVALLMPGQQLHLFIDQADRFSEGDFSQVAHLAEILPDNVKLTMAVSTQSIRVRRDVRALIMRGVANYPVMPLNVTDLSYWIVEKGVRPEFAERIHKVTGGYPIFVPAAIRAVREKRHLSDVPVAQIFDLETQTALLELDSEISTIVRRLSAFTDPLLDERIADYLDLDIYKWGDIQARLTDAGIFNSRTDGKPWFHEQRRKSIWRVLTDAERRDAAERAFTELRQTVERTASVNPDTIVALADIVTSVPEIVDTEAKAKAVAVAPLDEIAVLAAVIELAESTAPGQMPTASGASVLAHTRHKFSLDIDLTVPLASLRSKELLFEKSNNEASVVIPTLDNLATYIAVGRAGRDLGRLPIPQLATNVFEATIKWRLGLFSRCLYGIGAPSPATISADLFAEESRTPGQVTYPRRPGRNILALQLRLGSEPLFCGAQFSTADELHQASERFYSLESKLFGHEIDLVRNFPLPQVSVAARRILVAAERVVGKPLGTADSIPTSTYTNTQRAKDSDRLQNTAAHIAEVLRIARSICSEDERIAFNLLDRRRVAFLSNDRDLLTIEIFGNEDGVVDLQDLVSVETQRRLFARGPYRSFELERALQLKPEDRLGMFHYRSSGHADSVYDCMFDLCKEAAHYNRYRPRRRIPLDQTSLENLLNEAVRQTYQDAQLLASALPVFNKELRPHHIYLQLSQLNSGFPDSVLPVLSATYAVVELDQGEQEAATVHISDFGDRLRPNYGDSGMSLKQAFNIPEERAVLISGESVGQPFIANMLGYMTSDLEFEYPEEWR